MKSITIKCVVHLQLESTPLYIFCFLLIIGLGFFGGELVYCKRDTVATGKKAEPPIATPGAMIQTGAELFTKRCAFCHLTGSRKTKIGPGLQALYQRRTLPISKRPVTEENLRRQLTAPVKNMPSFPNLSEQDVLALIVYMKTL